MTIQELTEARSKLVTEAGIETSVQQGKLDPVFKKTQTPYFDRSKRQNPEYQDYEEYGFQVDKEWRQKIDADPQKMTWQDVKKYWFSENMDKFDFKHFDFNINSDGTLTANKNETSQITEWLKPFQYHYYLKLIADKKYDTAAKYATSLWVKNVDQEQFKGDPYQLKHHARTLNLLDVPAKTILSTASYPIDQWSHYGDIIYLIQGRVVWASEVNTDSGFGGQGEKQSRKYASTGLSNPLSVKIRDWSMIGEALVDNWKITGIFYRQQYQIQDIEYFIKIRDRKIPFAVYTETTMPNKSNLGYLTDPEVAYISLIRILGGGGFGGNDQNKKDFAAKWRKYFIGDIVPFLKKYPKTFQYKDFLNLSNEELKQIPSTQ